MIETGAVPPTDETTTRRSTKEEDASVGEVIDFVKAYAKQETIGPLKGAGRWLGFGFGGAFALGLGLMLVLLGFLRLMQTEFEGWWVGGSWGWLPYLIAGIVAGVLLALTIKRIQQATLNKEPE